LRIEHEVDVGKCRERTANPSRTGETNGVENWIKIRYVEGMNTKITLLVVDDSKSICAAVKRGLERTLKYTVHVASSGQEGFSRACELLPDIILLDMMMPMITGAECSKRLKRTPQTAHIPVIYLTGLMSKDDVKAFGGVIDGEQYLAKPVCIEEIMAAVEGVLGRKE